MPEVERPIVITNDLGGVHFHGQPPIVTFLELLSLHLRLPAEGEGYKDFTPPPSKPKIYKNHSLKSGALEGMLGFKEVAQKHNRDLELAILSGRQRAKHDDTKVTLQEVGYTDIFDHILLNPWKSSNAWKEFNVKKFAEQGATVVHLENDLKTALVLNRLNQYYQDRRILVYLFRNISTNPFLLRMNGLSIPSGVHLIDTFQEANDDFDNLLATGRL